MRIRQIKPSWWLDKDLRTRLSADAREFYIGLWMLADDDGWIEWDVSRIAAELYPYGSDGGLLGGDPISAREVLVADWSKALTGLDPDDPHLVILDCGHARVPKIVAHQRFGGRPVYGIRDAHARTCAQKRADARSGSAPRNGRERNGSGTVDARQSANGEETTSSFKEGMAAAGLDLDAIGRRMH